MLKLVLGLCGLILLFSVNLVHAGNSSNISGPFANGPDIENFGFEDKSEKKRYFKKRLYKKKRSRKRRIRKSRSPYESSAFTAQAQNAPGLQKVVARMPDDGFDLEERFDKKRYFKKRPYKKKRSRKRRIRKSRSPYGSSAFTARAYNDPGLYKAVARMPEEGFDLEERFDKKRYFKKRPYKKKHSRKRRARKSRSPYGSSLYATHEYNSSGYFEGEEHASNENTGLEESPFQKRYFKNNKWSSQIELESKVGTRRILGEPRLFIPLAEGERTLLFSDIRGTFDDFGSKEGNIGLGYRKISDSGWIFGGSLFLDFRRTGNGNNFLQGMVGVEALSTVWDFRANYYIPESTQKDIAGSGSATVVQSGTSLNINSQGLSQERALPGWDFEIGRHFPLKANSEFAVYGSWFRFKADGFEEISGPRGRVEMNWRDLPFLGYGSRFTVGGELQSDDVRGTHAFATVRLKIPVDSFFRIALGKKRNDSSKRRLSLLERRMTDFVIRDVDVVSGKVDKPVVNEAVQYDGNTVNQIVTIDANTAGGAVAAITAAGENSLIVLDGTAGSIDISTQATARVGQTIAGGGASLSFTGATSGQTALFTLPGIEGTLNQTNAAVNAINSAINTNYTGFTITGGLASILVTTSVSDVRISDMTVTGAGRGIYVLNTGDVTISNSTITSGTLEALRMTTVNNVSVFNNVINGTGVDGVYVSGIFDIDFSDNVINFTGTDDAMDIDGNINTFSGSGNTVVGNVPGLPCELAAASTRFKFSLTFKNVECR